MSIPLAFWERCVRPLLETAAPGLEVIAGRFGTGSDVLGYDDLRSRDHDWGLRLSLLVPQDRVREIDALLAERLPQRFGGLPVRFAFSGSSEAVHRVEVQSLEEFLRRGPGFDPRAPSTALHWLALTGQAALEVVAGPVFSDPHGRMAAVRDALTWYPDDVWRHVVACDWLRIDEELPLVGRTAEVGDDAGSRVIAARLVQVAVHLAFLLERRWAPYPKWFGTAARSLACWPRLGPRVEEALSAPAGPARQAALGDALEVLLRVQRDAGLPAPAPAVVPFWDRPFLRVAPEVPQALAAAITDDAVLAVPRGLGSAEQRTDLVPLLVDAEARRRLIASAQGARSH